MRCNARKDFDASIVEYRTAIAKDPGDSGYHHNLGIALRGKGRLDEALAELREAVRMSPEDACRTTSWASASWTRGTRTGPPPSSARRSDSESTTPPPRQLGNVLLERGEVDAAIAEFREALRLKPDSAGSLSNLGYALSTKGDYRGAVRACREAIRLDPKDFSAHLNLGIALMGLKKVDEAIAEYREAIRLGPGEPLAHNGLGGALLTSARRGRPSPSSARRPVSAPAIPAC